MTEMEKNMKKTVTWLLAMILILSLSACAKGKDEGGQNPEETGLAGFTVPQEGTAGKLLLDDFASRMDEDPSQSALALAEGILGNENILFQGMAMEVEPGFLAGFDEEVTGFKEGATFAPYIGTIPFAGYIFVLEEGADVKAFSENLKEHANPRWNICTEAEQTVIDYYGNTVFFLMCPESLKG